MQRRPSAYKTLAGILAYPTSNKPSSHHAEQMRSSVLTKTNILAFGTGLLIGAWSWVGSPPPWAIKGLSLLSGIGWLFVGALMATLLAFAAGYSKSSFGHWARTFHAWLHRRVIVRQQKAVSFLGGVLICPTLATGIEGTTNHFAVILMTLLLLATFAFYGYSLNAMADRLRSLGYLSEC